LDEHSHSVRVELGHQAGAVIGRGGVNLRSVQETSGAVLRIDRDALLEVKTAMNLCWRIGVSRL